MKRIIATAAAALACTAFGTAVVLGQTPEKVKSAVSWHSSADNGAITGARW